jgi:mono/diheme cytochrome c family protein
MEEVMLTKAKSITSAILILTALGLSVASLAADEGAPSIGDVRNGNRLYRVHCAVCHGFDGSGKGLAAGTLKTKPAAHIDGSLMTARDNKMVYRTIQLGCKGAGCKGAMPAFGDELNKLDTWDLVAYLRSLHMPLAAFFKEVDQYLVKRYSIGKVGNRDFKEGQMERLKKVLKKVQPDELSQTVFTLFRSHRRRQSPELVSQEPRELAKLRKDNKIGYVLFMELEGPRGRKVPVGVALDINYSIIKLVASLTEPSLAGEYNRRLEKYVGLGKRGDLPNFKVSRDKLGKIFDKAVTRVYMIAVEAANAYELEERERSWADGTF